MPKYSVITPVYNRPDEVDELLESLAAQTFKDFEVIIIEDGSTQKCDEVCAKYRGTLDIHYYFKENSGQGFSRNFGFEKANSDYFVQLDSDAILPETYFEAVAQAIHEYKWDAFGGPDKAHVDFTAIQKAVNYAMTSVFTTGGIRGKKKNMGGKYTPRSFNFGLSRKVWETVGGYKITRLGEDIEFSHRIIKAGFNVGFIEDAFIYHKRRTSFLQFFKQLHFFGRARINITRFFPEQLKLVHTFPMVFTLFIMSVPFTYVFYMPLFNISFLMLLAYFTLLFIDSLRLSKSIWVAILSVPACFIQLFAYGLGFIEEAGKGFRLKE
ncbi:glycosyltransferase [Jiulongibacter sediminis]|uniref:Beta-lactamase regulatory protein n=1 Tax=Jiulongibacter sediminis TaxID=1605367 RepID=A0A0P7BXA7_9BACT|nr:glycosyltransferase [Jiulongibacter sediminis]KPM49231.1 beta-lactamase regulatory protein [Jiulongibacter sediminis]TBX26285.1 beta-lactamase regulatory protein [Jiulongibacter sediminis]